jgi:endonuclease/exonuclease/phosphatase family metal-dependent hydrolase
MSTDCEHGFAGRLRIGTYNIAHGLGEANNVWQVAKKAELLDRLDDIARLLKGERLDLAVLNEVDVNSFRTRGINQVRYIARKAGLPFCVGQCHIDVSLGLVKHRYGNAVLSRHPISQTKRVSFPGHSLWETVLLGKKAGLLCTITLPDAREIRIMAVHLEHRLESKRLEAANRIEEVRRAFPTPLILAGDFNSTWIDSPPAMPNKDCQTAISWLLGSGAYRTLPSGQLLEEDMTCPAPHPTTVIDWILVPAAWNILSKRVIATTLSDHRPVIMEVEAPGTIR